MSEPTTFADRIETVVPGIIHWTVHDDRINFRSDAYAFSAPEGRVLIDPLPLSGKALESLGRVAGICLTGGQHQRAAWRYRRVLGVPVRAPEGATDLEEAPDEWFTVGPALPGSLRAILAPGCGPVHYAFLLERSEGGRALFCGDLVIREDDGPFALIPDKYVEDPVVVLGSVRKLVELAPEVLCPAHGAPEPSGGGEALHEALRRSA